MKRLVLLLVLLLANQSRAEFYAANGTFLRTEIRCTAADDPNITYSRTHRQATDKDAYISMLEYKFWPKMEKGRKTLTVTQDGVEAPVTQMDLGLDETSSATFPLVMKDGDRYNCAISITKYQAQAPINY